MRARFLAIWLVLIQISFAFTLPNSFARVFPRQANCEPKTAPDRLSVGQCLRNGESIVASGGLFELRLSSDGDLGLFGPPYLSRPLWRTNTGGKNANRVVLETGGNLVIYNAENKNVWSSNSKTASKDAVLAVRGQGFAGIFENQDFKQSIWTSNKVPPAPTAVAGSKMLGGQGLYMEQIMRSDDGRFYLKFHADGNLVLYDAGDMPYWQSYTRGATTGWAAMVADGKLKIVDLDGKEIWSTPKGAAGAYLKVQNNGNMILFDANNQLLWETYTFWEPGWMASNLALLGERPLRRICVPSTHNSGMSTLTFKTSDVIADANILCQTLSIYDQLRAGIREFDLRPVIRNGQFYAGHFSHIEALGISLGWEGGTGQSFDEMIDQLNKYLATRQELVIIELSHALDADRDFNTMTQAQWESFFDKLLAVKNRYTTPTPPKDLTTLTLNTFLRPNGASQPRSAVVFLLTQPGISIPARFATQGFYTGTNQDGEPRDFNNQFPLTGKYSNDADINQIVADQGTKLASSRKSANDRVHLLSWIATNAELQDFMTPPFTILDRAVQLNNRLDGFLREQCTKDKFPNWLNVDNVRIGPGTPDMVGMAMWVNREFGGA